MAAPKGHPKYAGSGRAVGVPNKLTVSIREAIMHAFDAVGGEAYLARIAIEEPAVFCTLLGKLLPLQIASKDADGDRCFTITIGHALPKQIEAVPNGHLDS